MTGVPRNPSLIATAPLRALAAHRRKTAQQTLSGAKYSNDAYTAPAPRREPHVLRW